MPTETSEPTTYADDLNPGDAWDIGSHVVTDDELVEFGTTWDPQYFHVDAARAAENSQYGGLIASGIHTLAIYQRLSIANRISQWHVIAGASIRDLKFRRPVRPDDLLTGRMSVTGVEMEPEKDRGLVTYAGVLSNQFGKEVLTVTMSAYVEARPAS